jgi:hypothetical protein
VTDLDDQGFGSFQVPFEYARALIAEARSLNKRMRHKLPVAYSVWRPLIEVNGSGKKSTKLPSTALEPRALDSETMALAQHGDELYQMSEFISWLYEPTERVEPYMTRYWNAYNLPEASTSRRSRGRKDKQKDQEQKALLEALISESLKELVDDKWRVLHEQRLRRQAALFHFADRERETALTSAVAALLHPSSNVPAQEQPFLRAMMRISIEQGPLRMMVESLGAGNLGAIPINLFGEE